MKKFILSLAAIVLCAGAYAKDTSRTKKSPEEIAAKRSAQMKEKLDLSEDQKNRVYSSTLTSISKKQAVKAKYKDMQDKKGMRTEMQGIRDSFDADMKTILTAEQYAKWQGMKARQKEKHKEKHKEKKAKAPKAKASGS